MDDHASVERIFSGAGIAIAAAAVMIIAFALFRSTGPANDAVLLQSVASEVCGDIGTVATSSVAYCYNMTYETDGVAITITSDYVVARDNAGGEFARQLPVRVYPGTYASGGPAAWHDPAGMREYINTTFGGHGTEESPLNTTAGHGLSSLLENARRDMAADPLLVRMHEPLAIEKLFLHTYNDTSRTMESEPYVFVFQR